MNPSMTAATVAVDALVALGVRDVAMCPGSRSAPLAYALAAAADAGRLRLHVRLDERTAGFLALGAALASGEPACVVTTSGTAVANLHPAVLEADAAGVPLLVLSADRPHELRGVGANQVTDQVKLFGGAVRRFVELPAGPADVHVRQQVSRAVAAARGTMDGRPGPVHVNIAFADPLVPEAGDPADPADPAEPAEPAEFGAARPGLTVVDAAAQPVAVRIPAGPRTVVLAGHGAGATPLVVARAAGWPLLAEPSSGARMEDAVGPYRLLLDRPDLGGQVQRVLLYGKATVSRQVTRLLARPDVEVVVVSTRPDWADPGGRADRVVAAVDPPLAGTGPAEGADDWLDAWLEAGRSAAEAVDAVLAAELAAGRLPGQVVAREVAAATKAGDALLAGSSNPVRDLDLVAGPFPGSVRWVGGRRIVLDGAARVFANRGLAGIDGTVSTGLGLAVAGSGRTRALLGDLTLLHDLGALVAGVHEERAQLQLVVVDDAGGGIFEMLEHGARAAAGTAEKALYERFFATPQQVDLGLLCSGLGVEHEEVGDLGRLRALLRDPSPGLSVLQVRVERSRERDLADRLAAAVAEVGRAVDGTALG